MGRPQPLVLRARVVLPVRRPPIEDGAVVVSKGRILAVGQWRYVRRHHIGPANDLGEVILLPGLVNAHCHLDYTGMAGMWPSPRSFCDWIKCITTEKSVWSPAEFAESWREGAAMLLRSGTTTVGDIEALPELLPEGWRTTPLRVISFLEMTGIRSRRAPRQILQESVEKIDALPLGRCAAGLSPHAPYSTLPELMRLSARVARRRRWLLTTHVAESVAEFEMFAHGRGEMFDWLQRSERPMTDCGGTSPVKHLEATGLLARNLLAIHVNYLAPGDADLLARRHVSVVHCPRSHEYFRHEMFPRRALAKAGVNLCLGTDSLATVRKHPREHIELSLFDELRSFAKHHSGMRPEALLRMVTLNPASALGLNGQAGELTAGAKADLVTIPFNGSLREAIAALVAHRGPVAAGMIGGLWVWPSGQ
jgi:cytosine/adenosine deaminase-related metal-dependent hydrolase